MSIYDDELPVDDTAPVAPEPTAVPGLSQILAQMPAGVPQGPPAPIMAPQIAHDPRQRILSLAALAAAIAGGPHSGLGGLAGGVLHGQQVGQAQADQRAQLEAQQQARQQSYQLAQERSDSQRNDVRRRALDSITNALPSFDNKEDYDKFVDFAGQKMLASGFRDMAPNNLRVMFPFTAPTAEKKAGKVLDAWFKNPANAAALKKDPSLAFKASVQVDLNGDGVPENVPLTKIGEIAKRPFAQGPDGQPIQLGSGVDTSGSKFEVALKNQVEQFKATNRREPTPKEVQTLIESASNIGKDPEMADLSKQSKQLQIAMQQLQMSQQPSRADALPLAQDLVNNKMAPSQLSLLGGFGASGQAFKRMVLLEAKKLDPEFNFEEAEGTYQLAKSPGFQQTVRYMDYVGESVDNVITAARKLGNGDVRSINALMNAGRNQFNSVDLARFKTARLEVADAIAKILQGGGSGSGTSDAKLKQAESILRESDSPASIAASMAEIKDLIGKRRKTLTRGTFLESAGDPVAASFNSKMGIKGQ